MSTTSIGNIFEKVLMVQPTPELRQLEERKLDCARGWADWLRLDGPPGKGRAHAP